MASLLLNPRAGLAALLCAIAPIAEAAAQPPEVTSATGAPISLNMDSSEVDFRSGKTLMHKVSIAQGTVSITADRAEATGLDVDNNRWVFSGDVQIQAENRGNLRSSEATVDFRDSRIARATVTGKPAEFEQRGDKDERLARGHAGEIVYDVEDGTVRLSGNAWLSDGKNEISGPLLVYNIREQHVQASTTPGGKERVHIIIVPKGPQERPQPSVPPKSK